MPKNMATPPSVGMVPLWTLRDSVDASSIRNCIEAQRTSGVSKTTVKRATKKMKTNMVRLVWFALWVVRLKCFFFLFCLLALLNSEAGGSLFWKEGAVFFSVRVKYTTELCVSQTAFVQQWHTSRCFFSENLTNEKKSLILTKFQLAIRQSTTQQWEKLLKSSLIWSSQVQFACVLAYIP